MIAVWAVLLIFSVVAYGVLVALVIPNAFLNTGFSMSEPTDRGLKNIVEPRGRTIVYEPSIKFRKYVKQYLISDRGGRKILLCKTDESVRYLDYDVAMYDRRKHLVKVLNVKELIEKPGYTQELELPEAVAFVSLILNEADDTRFEEKLLKPVSKGKMGGYIVVSSLCSIFEIAFAKVCCANLFGGVFKESYLIETTSVIVTCVFALVAVVVNIVVAAIAIKRRNGKPAVEGEQK
ncbi:MAG: hypothetical protein IJ506_00520 [Clostridia bacterium]|nr:hypothetical protein [Clostridia bacterium]